jgi:hypothetical protein
VLPSHVFFNGARQRRVDLESYFIEEHAVSPPVSRVTSSRLHQSYASDWWRCGGWEDGCTIQ